MFAIYVYSATFPFSFMLAFRYMNTEIGIDALKNKLSLVNKFILFTLIFLATLVIFGISFWYITAKWLELIFPLILFIAVVMSAAIYLLILLIVRNMVMIKIIEFNRMNANQSLKGRM